MYPTLLEYLKISISQFQSIPDQRKMELENLANYILEKLKNGETVNLNFICTHNSRRSHLSQIWAETATAYFGLKNIRTFSGGTEATAFNPRAVEAIKRAGFKVENPGGQNPKYQISFEENAPKIVCFSKTYDDSFNPKNIVAIMTCSDADQNCPFIPGASLRAPIRYKDPKEADDTPLEAERYDERCRQISTEMFYLMSIVKEKNGK